MARVAMTEGCSAVADRIRERRGGRLRPLDQALLHSPPVADGWNTLLGAIRERTGLAPALRELVILRVAVLNRAGYEWAAHLPVAERAGLAPAALAAIQRADAAQSPALDELQRAVIAYTDAITLEVQVPDDVFHPVHARLGDAGLVELTATVAAYNMVSRFLVALHIDNVDDDTAAPPRDG